MPKAIDNAILEMARGIYAELGRGSDRDIAFIAKALDAQHTHGWTKGVKDTVTEERKSHRIMTAQEYEAMLVKGWHEVCRDVDGDGNVGVRFIATS